MNKRIDPTGYGIEDWESAHLMPNYEPFFAPLVGKGIRLLELGIREGASLRFWRDYLENATIVGLDCNAVDIDDATGMIRIYRGYQQNTELLDRIVKEQARDGFDVVINDCSHIGRLARISFWHLFQNHLKLGGLYAIEDWGTG
jgi:spermidine synthase